LSPRESVLQVGVSNPGSIGTASSTAGACARSRSVPTPTARIAAASRWESVSSSASGPKSSAWLLASVTQSTPRCASASAAYGGARKWKTLPGVGSPRAEMQVEDEEVGLPNAVDELRRKERVRWLRLQPLGDSPPEHRVSPERELHDSRRRSHGQR
jgi:hypothetical protein